MAHDSVSLSLMRSAEAPAMGRALVASVADEWGMAGARAAVLLAVSELVTNAVRHGAPPMRLALTRQVGEILVEVSDSGSGLAEPRFPAPSEDSGRGLMLVDSLASRWGVKITGEGKVVWCAVRT